MSPFSFIHCIRPVHPRGIGGNCRTVCPTCSLLAGASQKGFLLPTFLFLKKKSTVREKKSTVREKQGG